MLSYCSETGEILRAVRDLQSELFRFVCTVYIAQKFCGLCNLKSYAENILLIKGNCVSHDFDS